MPKFDDLNPFSKVNDALRGNAPATQPKVATPAPKPQQPTGKATDGSYKPSGLVRAVGAIESGINATKKAFGYKKGGVVSKGGPIRKTTKKK